MGVDSGEVTAGADGNGAASISSNNSDGLHAVFLYRRCCGLGSPQDFKAFNWQVSVANPVGQPASFPFCNSLGNMEGTRLATNRTASTSYSLFHCPAPAGRRAHSKRIITAALGSRDITTGFGWRGELPKPADYKPGVIPGVRTIPTPILSPNRVGIMGSWGLACVCLQWLLLLLHDPQLPLHTLVNWRG